MINQVFLYMDYGYPDNEQEKPDQNLIEFFELLWEIDSREEQGDDTDEV